MATSISPLVLPIKAYTFSAQQAALKSTASIAFTDSATLTASGGLGGSQISASANFGDMFRNLVWLQGTGALKATPTLTFSESARLAGGILGATSITFSTVANLRGGVSSLDGATTITFSESVDLNGRGFIAGATTLTFSESFLRKGQLKFATIIRFINPGQLFRAVAGSLSFAFSSTGTLRGRPSVDRIEIFMDRNKIELTGKAGGIQIFMDHDENLIK